MRENELLFSLGFELNTNTFESLLSEILKRLQTQRFTGNTITFNMSKLRLIRIGGLVSFLSLCGAIKENKLFSTNKSYHIYLELPSNRIMEYLHWMQFFKIADIYSLIQNSGILSERDNEYYKKWKAKLTKYRDEIDPLKKEYYRTKIFPIHLIQSNLNKLEFDSVCWNFVNDLTDVFNPIFDYDLNHSKGSRRGFFEANHELYKNIFDHSKSWGIVAIQVEKSTITFSYSDIGVGIKNSLAEFIRYKYNLREFDDYFAIKEAIKKGVSSKEIDSSLNDNMGLGLHRVTEYMRKNQGRMVIRSGKCLYPVNSKPKRVSYFPGTQIHIALPKLKLTDNESWN